MDPVSQSSGCEKGRGKDDSVKLSSQEEYGLRCLVRLARSGERACLTISELSKLEGLSNANVAKMLRLLRKAGFIKSVRGQAGGYRLAAPPSEIRVAEVLDQLGGRLYDDAFCRRHVGSNEEVCRHDLSCSVRPLWLKLQLAVDDAMRTLTVADLLDDSIVEVRIPRPAGRIAVP